MNTYLYLLAWVSGSDGACGEDNNIHSQDDLLPQYLACNVDVFAIKINIPFADRGKTIACKYGDSAAFHNGYTSNDTTSICISVDADFRFPGYVKEVFV
jgi:hypothetical protein